MRDGLHVMDSDLHVMEGAEAFETYFDPKYRAEMPEYLGLAPNHIPHWSVAGQVIPPWALDPAVAGAQKYLQEPTEDIYRPLRERHFDAASTLEAMDVEGLDVAVVYRTFAHMVVSIDGLKPEVATASCAAFNDWLADYCAADKARLKPAAIVTLHDPELAAAEARRAVEDKGHVAVVVLPMPVNGRYVNAPECDVIWREAVRLDVPVAFHGTSGAASLDYVANRFRGHPNFRTLNHASSFPLEMMLAMGAMLVGGVCERFPKLRVGFLEGNCGWLPWWLDRLDDQWRKYGGGEAIKLSALPSEIFKRQGFIATDVDEALLATVIDRLGDDNIVMSIDYPHTDGPYPNGITEFLELPGVGRESKKKIMWDNCVRLYGFEPESLAAG
ncbi:MAG: amidohydrolase family protein [Kiloniellales bacterium]